MYRVRVLAWLTLLLTWTQLTVPVAAGSVEGLLSKALKGSSSRHYVFGDDSSYEPGDYYLTMRQAMPMPPGPSNIPRPSDTPTPTPSGTALPSPSVTPVHSITPSPQFLEERQRCKNLVRKRTEEFTEPYLALKKKMRRLVRLISRADSPIDRAILQARLDALRAEEVALLIRGEKLFQILQRNMCFSKMSPSPMPSMTPSNSPSPSPTTRKCRILNRKLRVNLGKLTFVKRKKSQIRLKLKRSTLTRDERVILRAQLADRRLEEFELTLGRAILLEKSSTAGC